MDALEPPLIVIVIAVTCHHPVGCQHIENWKWKCVCVGKTKVMTISTFDGHVPLLTGNWSGIGCPSTNYSYNSFFV
jgi:hypothetical protein